jgi:hypothetical protein
MPTVQGVEINNSFISPSCTGDTNGPRLIAKFTTGSESLQSGWSGDVSSQQGRAVACAFNTPKLTLHLRSRALQLHEEGQSGHGRRERATFTKCEHVKLHVVLSQALRSVHRMTHVISVTFLHQAAGSALREASDK